MINLKHIEQLFSSYDNIVIFIGFVIIGIVFLLIFVAKYSKNITHFFEFISKKERKLKFIQKIEDSKDGLDSSVKSLMEDEKNNLIFSYLTNINTTSSKRKLLFKILRDSSSEWWQIRRALPYFIYEKDTIRLNDKKYKKFFRTTVVFNFVLFVLVMASLWFMYIGFLIKTPAIYISASILFVLLFVLLAITASIWDNKNAAEGINKRLKT